MFRILRSLLCPQVSYCTGCPVADFNVRKIVKLTTSLVHSTPNKRGLNFLKIDVLQMATIEPDALFESTRMFSIMHL